MRDEAYLVSRPPDKKVTVKCPLGHEEEVSIDYRSDYPGTTICSTCGVYYFPKFKEPEIIYCSCGETFDWEHWDQKTFPIPKGLQESIRHLDQGHKLMSEERK